MAKIISIKKHESTGKYTVRWSFSLKGERMTVTTNYIYYNTGTGKRFQKRGRGPELPERLYEIMDKRISGGKFELIKVRKKPEKLMASRDIQRGAYSNQIRQRKYNDD